MIDLSVHHPIAGPLHVITFSQSKPMPFANHISVQVGLARLRKPLKRISHFNGLEKRIS